MTTTTDITYHGTHRGSAGPGTVEVIKAAAADMLSRFVKAPGGYCARVGQIQISKWAEQIGK